MDKLKQTIESRPLPIIIGLAVVIVVLIVLVVWNYTNTNGIFYNMLEGMWIASDEFCKKSDIDGMMLYIGPPSGRTCKAYLIMYSNNTIILQKQIEIAFGFSLGSSIIQNDIVKAACITEIEPETPDDQLTLDTILPKDQTIHLSIAQSKMVWSALDPEQEEIIQYAEFYKDNISTNMAAVEDQ